MIEINNLTKEKIAKKTLERIAEKVLEGERKASLNLSIVLVGQARIKELNRMYRKKDKATDVLSFFYDNFASPDAGAMGEIIICPDKVKENAKEYKSSFSLELARVLIHGVLHILGYDHEAGAEKAEKMQRKEENYLSQI